MQRNRLVPFVVAALVLVAAGDLWWLVGALHRASYVSGLTRAPQDFVLADAAARDQQVRHGAIAVLITEPIAAVLFITWLYRLVGDVAQRRPGSLRFGKGWAIGGWFVPVLNFARPKQVVDDAWRAASPPSRFTGPPWWVQAWWGTWIVAGLVFFAARVQDSTTLSGLVHRDRFDAAGCAVDIACAVFAVMTVVSLSNRVMVMPEPVTVGYGQHGMRFNPAPGWPAPPVGWLPPPGWRPEPGWPPPPPDWRFWVPTDS